MSKQLAVAAIVVVVLAMNAADAQTPKPTPEHGKIQAFLGTWQYDIDTKASPFGPAGKMTGTDRIEPGPGGFSVVYHPELTGPAGTISGLAILTYDAAMKRYVIYSVDSSGAIAAATGTVNGTTWSFDIDASAGGKKVKGRNKTTFTSPTAYTWTFEIADDKGVYSLVEEGRAMKRSQ